MSFSVNQAASSEPDRGYTSYDPDEGLGWMFFAASMLGIAGIMRILDAIWAFRAHKDIPQGLKDATFGSSLTNYGWIWLGVGVVLILASFLLMVKSQFARWIGFLAAAIGAITAVTWMPYYPVWSFLYIALAVLVFYALAAHGGRDA
jgi:hypothetical protein